ncbi:unnamed protein product [Rhizophagus irregularis]|nr:unnamed protein product [Rhizophagus irregularis]
MIPPEIVKNSPALSRRPIPQIRCQYAVDHVTWRVIRDFTVVQWRKEDPRKYYTSFLTRDMLIGEELLRQMRRGILESR